MEKLCAFHIRYYSLNNLKQTAPGLASKATLSLTQPQSGHPSHPIPILPAPEEPLATLTSQPLCLLDMRVFTPMTPFVP